MVEFDQTSFATHRSPDLDALLGLWVVSKHAPNWNVKRVICLSDDDIKTPAEDMLYVDIGGGPFDHHDTNERISSAYLVAKHLGVDKEPAYATLVEASIKADHGEPVADTDLRYLIGSLIHRMNIGKIQLPELLSKSFELFDSISETQVYRAECAKKLSAFAEWITVPGNGIRVCVLNGGERGLASAAFEVGAQVVVARSRWRGQTHTAVLTNNQMPVNLKPVIRHLRVMERQQRQLPAYRGAVDHFQNDPSVEPAWFYHSSGNIILNGSKKHPLADGQASRLDFEMIKWLVIKGLETVSVT